MTRDELTAHVLSAIAKVAPEADGASLSEDAPLRRELDIDSMDFLNFITELHALTGVDVPESDYAKLSTLRACVDYLAPRVSPV
jgi:acyl carrier protein